MTATNIKNLPDGEYVTEFGYSQAYPWKVIKTTPKTMTIQRVEVEKDPDWIPEMHAGGFLAHCSNQGEQTWLYAGMTDHTRTIRKTKLGWSLHGVKYARGNARYFYDYNF